MNQQSPAVKVWSIVYPFLFYYAVMLVTMVLAQWVFGSGKEHYVLCQLISTLVTLPFMLPFYRQDQALRGIANTKPQFSEKKAVQILLVVGMVLCFSIALNNIISMTPLVEISEGYREANAGFYGSTLALELISSAVFTPILEELVFRGIIFGRLRGMMPKLPAVVLSSLIFAAIHFNIVQFIYALLLGMVLALLMDKVNKVYPAVIGHMTANLIAVLRTETGILENTVQKDAFSWGISIALLAVGAVLLWRYLAKEES